VLDGAAVGIQAIEPGVGADPQAAIAVAIQRGDAVAGQAVDARLVMPPVAEMPAVGLQPVHAGLAGGDPQRAVAAVDQLGDVDGGQRIGAPGIVHVAQEGHPVIAHQPARAAEPQEALRILHHRVDGDAGQPLLEAETPELRRRQQPLRRHRRGRWPGRCGGVRMPARRQRQAQQKGGPHVHFPLAGRHAPARPQVDCTKP
jgi:hypothetical protein